MLPTNAELPALISSLQEQLNETEAALTPYRENNNAKAPPTEQELAALETEWAHWRAEWKKRKTWFKGSVLQYNPTHRLGSTRLYPPHPAALEDAYYPNSRLCFLHLVTVLFMFMF